MKKVIFMGAVVLGILVLTNLIGVVNVIAQNDSTEVVESTSGFWGFYNKYATAIWLILGTSGAAVYFWARARRVLNFVKVLLVAGDDTSPQGKIITQEEWNGIIAAGKAIFGKLTDEEKNQVVSEIKNKQSNNYR